MERFLSSNMLMSKVTVSVLSAESRSRLADKSVAEKRVELERRQRGM